MTPGSDALARLLAELRSVAPIDDGPVLDDLERRLSSSVLRVLVAGEAKRGKSTLLNALLGRDVLPTGVVPVTAVATVVRSGPVEQVVARFADGSERTLPMSALPGLVTEDANPGNVRGVRTVEVQLPTGLPDGVELVDTPGVGSVHEHNTAEAETALGNMDAAVFVLTADLPISASERAFLRSVRGRAVRLFCVLNKVDRLDAAELQESLGFTRRVLDAELGADMPIHPLSARAERSCPGGEPGFARFLRDFSAYLRADASADLRRSVAGHAARIAQGVIEIQEATLAALAVSEEELADRLSRFRAAQAEVERQRVETAAVATEEFRRLQRGIDGSAAEVIAAEGPPLIRAVVRSVEANDGAASAMERDALAEAARGIERIVEDWRAARAAELDEAVRALDQRTTARLSAQIATVRDAAAEVFGIAMPALPPPAPLAVTGRIGYSFSPDPGPVDSLTTAVRTRLPVLLARPRVQAHVTQRAQDLLDRHVGRCAAGFRAELIETARRFVREMDRRFHEGAGRIGTAIEAAATMRPVEAPRVAAARAAAEGTLERARDLAGQAEALSSGKVCQDSREPTA